MEFTNDIEFNINPTANQDLNITYHGFLGNSQELYIVYGFNENWENTTEAKMEKSENGFTATIKMLDFDTFNFCFKNEENIWDNNSNCNYISIIAPCQNEQVTESVSFDIDALIEQILEPIMFKDKTENVVVKIESEPIDLGVEVSNALSQIKSETQSQNLVEYESLDEILSGNVIEEKNIELFEAKEEEEISKPETALINIDDPFMISSRQLSRFYLIKKQIKLFFYKAFVKIPKLIFGLDED